MDVCPKNASTSVTNIISCQYPPRHAKMLVESVLLRLLALYMLGNSSTTTLLHKQILLQTQIYMDHKAR